MVTVYLLRHQGEKLDQDAVRRTAVKGWLSLRKGPIGQPTLHAELRDAQGRELMQTLDYPAIKRIERGGFMLHGLMAYFGVNGRECHRQSWWCVPAEGADNDEHIKEP